jgi:phospholipid/cholesterol/gamma-HCH transport system substrate-binding protein
MRRLPKVMSGAQKASGSLNTLSAGLGPVAKDIDKAAPDLNKALVQVPAVTKDLRGLLPALNATLVRAPATLRRVPAVAHDAQDLVPTLQVALSDINPTLSFLEPYGPDLAAFFANWTAMLQQSDVNGHYLRIFGVLNEQSVKNSPLDTNVGPLKKSNAYPAPGESRDPGPYEGTYPRVKRENP